MSHTAFAVLQLWEPLTDEMAPDMDLNVFVGRILLYGLQHLV